MSLAVSKTALIQKNWIIPLIFLYFFTTSADLLHIEVSLFHFKVNHALSLVLFILCAIQKKRWVLPDKKLFLAFLATIVAMGLSAIGGIYPYRSLIYLLVYIFTFLAYFLLPFNLFLLYGKERIFKLYFLAFVVTGIIGTLQFFLSLIDISTPFVTQYMLDTIARGQALAYEPSYYALFLVPYVMYLNARFLFDCEKVIDFSRLKGLFVKNLFLLVSTSTGAFFAYFVFFLVTLFVGCFRWVRESRRKIVGKLFKMMSLFSLLFVSIALAMPELFLRSFWKFFHTGFMQHGSFVDRLYGIISSHEAFLQHPLLGVGIGGVGPFVYQQCLSQGRAVSFHEPYSCMFDMFDPTNVFWELLASLGVVGFFVFGYFFFLYLRILHQTAKLPHLSREEKSTIYSLIISVGVMLIVLQFNQNLFRSYVWVHLAICLGYCFTLKNEKKLILKNLQID